MGKHRTKERRKEIIQRETKNKEKKEGDNTNGKQRTKKRRRRKKRKAKQTDQQVEGIRPTRKQAERMGSGCQWTVEQKSGKTAPCKNVWFHFSMGVFLKKKINNLIFSLTFSPTIQKGGSIQVTFSL